VFFFLTYIITTTVLEIHHARFLCVCGLRLYYLSQCILASTASRMGEQVSRRAVNSNPTPRLVLVTRLGRSMTDARALVSSCAPSASRDSLVARGSALSFMLRRSSHLAQSACPRLSRGRVSVTSRSGARRRGNEIGEVDRLSRRNRPLASRASVFDVDGDAERCWEYVYVSSLASSWARARRVVDNDVRRR